MNGDFSASALFYNLQATQYMVYTWHIGFSLRWAKIEMMGMGRVYGNEILQYLLYLNKYSVCVDCSDFADLSVLFTAVFFGGFTIVFYGILQNYYK